MYTLIYKCGFIFSTIAQRRITHLNCQNLLDMAQSNAPSVGSLPPPVPGVVAAGSSSASSTITSSTTTTYMYSQRTGIVHLDGKNYAPEESIPPIAFDCNATAQTSRPHRLLDDFTISVEKSADTLRGVEEIEMTPNNNLNATKRLQAYGRLLHPSGDPSKSLSVLLRPLVEWSLEDDGENVSIWIATDRAWYQLRSPSAKYRAVHAAVLQKAALYKVTRKALLSAPASSSYQAVLQQVRKHTNTFQ